MALHQTLAKHPLARQHALLLAGFWLITLLLLLYQVLVVFPANSSGLVHAYYPGHSMKNFSLPVPIYSLHNSVRNLLILPVMLVLVFVTWIGPVVTIVWGVLLGKSGHRISRRTKWIWLSTLMVLWWLTIQTRDAAWPLWVWLMD
jgi:hypothetical protein